MHIVKIVYRERFLCLIMLGICFVSIANLWGPAGPVAMVSTINYRRLSSAGDSRREGVKKLLNDIRILANKNVATPAYNYSNTLKNKYNQFKQASSLRDLADDANTVVFNIVTDFYIFCRNLKHAEIDGEFKLSIDDHINPEPEEDKLDLDWTSEVEDGEPVFLTGPLQKNGELAYPQHMSWLRAAATRLEEIQQRALDYPVLGFVTITAADFLQAVFEKPASSNRISAAWNLGFEYTVTLLMNILENAVPFAQEDQGAYFEERHVEPALPTVLPVVAVEVAAPLGSLSQAIASLLEGIKKLAQKRVWTADPKALSAPLKDEFYLPFKQSLGLSIKDDVEVKILGILKCYYNFCRNIAYAQKYKEFKWETPDYAKPNPAEFIWDANKEYMLAPGDARNQDRTRQLPHFRAAGRCLDDAGMLFEKKKSSYVDELVRLITAQEEASRINYAQNFGTNIIANMLNQILSKQAAILSKTEFTTAEVLAPPVVVKTSSSGAAGVSVGTQTDEQGFFALIGQAFRSLARRFKPKS